MIRVVVTIRSTVVVVVVVTIVVIDNRLVVAIAIVQADVVTLDMRSSNSSFIRAGVVGCCSVMIVLHEMKDTVRGILTVML